MGGKEPMLSLTRTRLGPRGGETYQLDFVFCDIAMFEPLDQMGHGARWPSLTSVMYAVADIALVTPLIDDIRPGRERISGLPN